jgi:ATP-dependent helicase/nuclease subunit A
MHPIVAQTRPSADQQPAITARGCDVVVTAGAGAGKTSTLVARYLDLLAENPDVRPQQLVAITFTKKAAREMRNRVRDRLRRFVEALPAGDPARARWDRLYSDLDAARIGTIHSLCTELLQAHPAEAGVDPRFEVLAEGMAGILQSQAVDAALAWAADDLRAAALFPLLGEKLLRASLEHLLVRRLDAAEAFARPETPLAERLQHYHIAPSPETDLDRELDAAAPQLRRLFAQAVEVYEHDKRERQALDFDDLEVRALRLLTDHPAVARRWQEEVRAILVDEYQDTNQRQRDLIARLNAGGRLFIVGDAKQSIYRFRGANVAVFQRERERIARESGQVFELSISYRAHRDLIVLLNATLKPVLGDERDVQHGVEPFAELRPARERPARGFEPPHVELHLAAGAKAGGAAECAARALAARLVALVEDGQCRVHAHERPLGYGDVAVLCRSSNSFGVYEDAFNAAGVPYVTVAGRGFYARPEVRDVLNALQAIADPTDDLALAGLLRSPAFAFTDEALYRLSAYRDARRRGAALWDVLEEAPLPPAAARARATIAELHALAGRRSVADLLKEFFDRTHILAALRRAGDRRAARNLTKLLADAHAARIPAVGEFLAYLGAVRETGAREGEARATVEGAVQLMTIHAAKGLEFPVVVIGDAGYNPPNRPDLLIDADLGVLVPLTRDKLKPALYQAGAAHAKLAEEAEERRLLYVAATRAQEKLIISGTASITTKKSNWSPRGWLKQLADAGLDFRTLPPPPGDGDPVTHTLHVAGQPVACVFYPVDSAAEAHAAARAAEAAAGDVQPAMLAPVRPAPDAGVEMAPARPPRVWRVAPAVERSPAGTRTPRAPQYVVGALVHAALAAWRFPDELGEFERWAYAQARTQGITDERQWQDAARAAARLLARFRAHPLCAEMERAPRRLAETPYSVMVAGRVDSGIIDALFERDGVWTIVEFKTDEVRRPGDLDDLLAHEDYLPQVRRYARAVRTLLDVEPRCVLCFLDVAGAVYLHEVDPGRGERIASHDGLPLT